MPKLKPSRRSVLREETVNHGQDLAELIHEADPDSRPVVHHRVFDTLGLLERNGSITAEMRQAGEAFRRHFQLAGLDPLHAAPLTRLPGGRGADSGLGPAQLRAKREVHAALDVIGGMASPAGSAVWHVIGNETSIREWAVKEGWGGRRISDKTAAGILIGALAALAVHYGLMRS